MARGAVIVGAGECGARAALALREAGHDGPVTLIGDEPHLPYERPPLSKELMRDGETPVARSIAAEQRFAALGITLHRGRRVVDIDRTAKSVALDDGSTLPYSKLLLATGCAPRLLSLGGSVVEGVCYLRSYDDALALHKRLVPGVRLAIIGGGFIGLELAAAAALRGAVVTVLESQQRILMRGVAAALAETLAAAHAAHGVIIETGVQLAAIAARDGAGTITLADGRSLTADLVVAGVGAVPRTELAEGAGLAVDNGIVVDKRLTTADPDILAAGDCANFPIAAYGGRRVRLESWRNAVEQGELAGRILAGAGGAHASVPWFWSDQYDLSLHIAGLADQGVETVRREAGEGAYILFHLDGDGVLVAASGIGPGNSIARDIKLSEMLIARRARPSIAQLSSPETRLKSLLAA